jgi:copper(I)-binding protein
MRRVFVLAVGLLIGAPAMAQTPAVQVDNAWARATAAGAKAGAIYLTLTDTGAPDHVVGASTPVAAMAQVHETVNDNGVMRMRPVPALPLETGKPVVLKPGSYHLMLMGLRQQLKPGDSFPVTLTFEHAAPVTATVTVGTAGASAPPMTHDMSTTAPMKMP